MAERRLGSGTIPALGSIRDIGPPSLRPVVPSGSRQGVDPLRSTGGVPFGRIPSGGAPAGGVPVKFLPPGGAPAGCVPLSIAWSGNVPDGDVPFGWTRSCGGPGGGVSPDTFVLETKPSGNVVDAVPMPESAVDEVLEPAVQPAVQAKQPRTEANTRIRGKMRSLPSPAGDSLFMSVLKLVIPSKNRGKPEAGGSQPRFPPSPYWSNRRVVIIHSTVSAQPPPLFRRDALSGQQEVRGGGICPLPHISFAVL